MDDVTWRSSSFDETAAALDSLHHADRERRSQDRRDLSAHLALLDVSSPDDEVEAGPAPRSREERDGRSGSSDPDPEPFFPLPRRTTHGGYWGPKLREKLTAIAMEKDARRW